MMQDLLLYLKVTKEFLIHVIKLLEMSNGEYIVWVDSDDFVDMDLLYTLWEKFHAVVMMHIVLIILALEVLPVN